MPRRLRVVAPGLVYHVLNRRVGRLAIFDDDADYAAFERVLEEVAGELVPMRVVAYCLMPNHWHLVLWPRAVGDLSRFMQRLTVTHMRRWHAHRNTAGTGPLYQGRFKSFPVQSDRHLLVVARYVERNPLRAGLVRRAEDWRWCSLWRRTRGEDEGVDGADAFNNGAVGEPTRSAAAGGSVTPLHREASTPRGQPAGWLLGLDDWPSPPPRNWAQAVNRPQTPAEEAALRRSVARGAPFGDQRWTVRTAARLKLQSSLRDPWRPAKAKRQPRQPKA